jgi:hypothetical protein
VFAGGNGTAECPYLIETADQLNRVRDNLDAHYRLIADIDLAGSDYPNWEPIGNNTSKFNGSFDGGGHTIFNLVINRPDQDYVGLFGSADTGTVIRYIGLENADVTGAGLTGGLVGDSRGDITGSYVKGNVQGSTYVGGLAGYHRTGTIAGSYTEGTVTASESYVGGITGENEGTITGSYAAGTVSSVSYHYAGGLVGYNASAIRNSFAKVTVSGNEKIGGLAGYHSGTIEKVYATGDVSGNNYVGGLVGHIHGNADISAAFATGSVTGGTYVGGLAGYFLANGSSISNAYATGAVTGSNRVGGLVGHFTIFSSGQITNTYAIGAVEGDTNVGGLVGSIDNSEVYSSYFNCDQPNNGVGTPKTLEELKQQGTYDETWDFDDVWFMVEGETYPRLRFALGFKAAPARPGGDIFAGEPFNLRITDATDGFGVMEGEYNVTVAGDMDVEIFNEDVVLIGGAATVEIALRSWGTHELDVRLEGFEDPVTFMVEVKPFAGGSGDDDDPYLIRNADQLNNVRDFMNAHFRLIDDINLAGYDWETIGNNSSVFNGTFDGDGHKISNLTINRPGQPFVGLFGNAGNSAVIRNVGLENANVRGYSNTGGLVGFLRGDIMNSFVEGNVHGNESVGGLAGTNNGTISNSYAEVAVTASYEFAGGLAGTNNGTISNSYAAGTVSTDDYAGGLVGRNYSTIRNSFATVIVTARDYVGGLAGSSTQSIERSFATGSVSGRNGVGGLAGNLNTNGSITDAYAAGAVTGTQNVGGLVGLLNTYGNITNTYATGKVDGDSDVGGLVGKHERGGIFDSYYDSNTTGQDNGPGTPKTTDELKRYATFAGWDFKNVWHIHDGQTYPRLRWEEASWDDYSGFAVQLEEAGDKVYGEAFNLTITEAMGEFGQVLDGEVQVTVAVVDGDVIYDESVEFAGGHATVTVKLQSVGLRTLTVQVNGIAAPQTITVTILASPNDPGGMTPDDLVSGIIWNKLKASDDGYEYRFVTNGTTAEALRTEFEQHLQDVTVHIQYRDGGTVPDDVQVPSGARVVLTRDEKYQYLDVYLLSDHVKEKTGRDGSERITLEVIIGYMIGHAEDVNGDGVFDRQDVRLLLGEIG